MMVWLPFSRVLDSMLGTNFHNTSLHCCPHRNCISSNDMQVEFIMGNVLILAPECPENLVLFGDFFSLNRLLSLGFECSISLFNQVSFSSFHASVNS